MCIVCIVQCQEQRLAEWRRNAPISMSSEGRGADQMFTVNFSQILSYIIFLLQKEKYNLKESQAW